MHPVLLMSGLEMAAMLQRGEVWSAAVCCSALQVHSTVNTPLHAC